MQVDIGNNTPCFDANHAGTMQRQQLYPDPYSYVHYVSEPRYNCDPVRNLSPGQRLANRFTIKSFLGQGGMGAVYRASDDLRTIDVALKIVPVTSEEIAHQLKHEINQSSMIANYEHIIHIYDMHLDSYAGLDLLLISMEYAEGGSLRQWLQQNRGNAVYRQSQGLTFIIHACTGLQALHQHGILHLDLKPENLLFRRGVLKISDLGLSQCISAISKQGNLPVDQEQWAPAGTPAYMSPEQVLPNCTGRIDVRSDIYSLGAVLYETFGELCEPPFTGSYEQIQEAHLHLPVPQVRGVDTNIAQVVSRCLQKDPTNRYGDVGELIADLRGRSNTPNEGQELHQATEGVEQWWRQACEFVQSGDLNAANRICSDILQRTPEHTDAQHLQHDIQERFDRAHQLYATISNGIGHHPFARLLTLLTAAMETYPNHPDGMLVQIELISMTEENERVMRNGVSALREGRWPVALSCFERADKLNPGQTAVTKAITFIKEVQHEIQTTRANIDTAIQQNDKDKALRLARSLDRYIEQAKAFAECMQSPENHHETQI
ncbi:protein kinase [Planctomycetota bacterium]